MRSIHVILACMIIAQLTLVGYMMLKKAPVAAPLLVPLFIITILFIWYLRQQHFRVAQHLPSEDCVHYEEIFMEEGPNYEFLRGHYRHPALKHKEIQPDNLPTPADSETKADVEAREEHQEQ